MLLKKIHRLKKSLNIKEHIERIICQIEEDYNGKIQSLKVELSESKEVYDSKIQSLNVELSDLVEDNKIKNLKISDMNEKIAFYEKETNSLTNDVMLLSAALKDMYVVFETMMANIESKKSFDYEEEVKDKKKKVFH